tara:strand:- start:2794 stop:3387 length:594 start_codon:yes stop_codon:yes gene_type:complete
MPIPSINYLKLSEKIKLGSPVIFPTDTLPALGILPEFSNKIWDIKERPLNKPLILMAANTEDLFQLVLSCAIDDAYQMSERYWPGPLTMVLPAVGKEVSLLNRNSNTIGIRVPANKAAIELLSQTGPLATTSANISGETPVLNEKQAFHSFPEIPLLGPLPWEKISGCASTVIFWNGPNNWKLLREGSLIPIGIRNK